MVVQANVDFLNNDFINSWLHAIKLKHQPGNYEKYNLRKMHQSNQGIINYTKSKKITEEPKLEKKTIAGAKVDAPVTQ